MHGPTDVVLVLIASYSVCWWLCIFNFLPTKGKKSGEY